jgi:hypothetical protein
LAAIVFGRETDVDKTIGEFIACAQRDGARVAGLVQEYGDDGDRAIHDIRVRDLTSGVQLPIMQNLGREASGCRVDSGAVAAAAGLVESAIKSDPDLLVVNRFGRLESEGGGLLAEIGDAVVRGLPVVIAVPARYLDAWNAFAGGLDTQLHPASAEIEAWWAAVWPASRLEA